MYLKSYSNHELKMINHRVITNSFSTCPFLKNQSPNSIYGQQEGFHFSKMIYITYNKKEITLKKINFSLFNKEN